ncbi:SHOCT domain-containing protein [Hymenobacter segetis]|uniref:SHOCT domain-containing protein n=1 Tax=Hymenobacter segetis TaxID=2025509 RepID=A0ABU9LZ37_9BACT
MNSTEKKFLDFVLRRENYGYLKFSHIDMINKQKYCEHGHLALGGTCSQCAQRTKPATEQEANPAGAPAPNRTLMELRELKSLLQKGLITEAEYDERRNNILANF